MCYPIFTELCLPLGEPDKELKLTQFYRQAKIVLMNDKFPELIDSLQQKNIKVFGFTRMIPGPGPGSQSHFLYGISQRK